MRSFPRIGCRRTAAVAAAIAVAVGALTVPSGPQAQAGELRDKQRVVHRKVERANHDARGVERPAATGDPSAVARSRTAHRGAGRAGRRTRQAGGGAAARRGDEGGAGSGRGPAGPGAGRRRDRQGRPGHPARRGRRQHHLDLRAGRPRPVGVHLDPPGADAVRHHPAPRGQQLPGDAPGQRVRRPPGRRGPAAGPRGRGHRGHRRGRRAAQGCRRRTSSRCRR